LTAKIQKKSKFKHFQKQAGAKSFTPAIFKRNTFFKNVLR